MNARPAILDINRRDHERQRHFQKVWYIMATGVCRRGELINVSYTGARLTTDLNVEVGDAFKLFNEHMTGTLFSGEVVVRWVRDLPGGTRKVVGVQVVDVVASAA